LQVKMLRVLQEKEITRTGGSNSLKIDVRIVAATNQDLKAQVRQKLFREDLFYRLNVVPLELPPLRERRDDIPALVEHFLKRAQGEHRTQAAGVTASAMQKLREHSWPGNIRELENTIQRAALLSPNVLLGSEDFQDLEATGEAERSDTSLEGLIATKLKNSLAQMDFQEMDNLYEMVLHQMERPLINIVLERTRGNQVRTAEILGINRNTLRKKIKTLGIDVKRNGVNS